MKKVSTILTAIDFSDNSANALKEANRMAKYHGAALHVAHIVTADEVDDFKKFFDVTFESVKERGGERLEKFVIAETGGTNFTSHILIGHPVYDLMSLVEELAADALVMGSRGLSEDDSREIGMMASQCVRKSPVPVLLIRKIHDEAFKRVAACVDFSENSRSALEAAASIAAQDGATLSVLHVHYPPWLLPTHVLYDLQTTPTEEFREEYEQALAASMTDFLKAVREEYPDLEIREEILEHTSVGYGITGFLKKAKIDLAAVGSHGRSFLGRMLLGSNAERIVHHSPCSVLVTKPPGKP